MYHTKQGSLNVIITGNFLSEMDKLCSYYKGDCDNCIMGHNHNNYNIDCHTYISWFPKQALENQVKWSNSHSR